MYSVWEYRSLYTGRELNAEEAVQRVRKGRAAGPAARPISRVRTCPENPDQLPLPCCCARTVRAI